VGCRVAPLSFEQHAGDRAVIVGLDCGAWPSRVAQPSFSRPRRQPLALAVGAVCLIAALFRLGFIADVLSKPVLVGYITGVGLTLLSSQLEKFTGVPIDANTFFPRLRQFLTNLDEIEVATR
jgi:hypothetical protein